MKNQFDIIIIIKRSLNALKWMIIRLFSIFCINIFIYCFRIVLIIIISSRYLTSVWLIHNKKQDYSLSFSFFRYVGICTTQDLDAIMSHMNNARYLREIDFARYHYSMRTELYRLLKKEGVTAILGGSCTRYRRPIPLFMPFKVTTKVKSKVRKQSKDKDKMFGWAFVAKWYCFIAVDLLGREKFLFRE